MNRYEHVGKLLVALDLCAVMSPTVEGVFSPDAIPEDLARHLTERLREELRIAGFEATFREGPEFIVNPRTRIVRSRVEELEEHAAALQTLRTEFHEADVKHRRSLEEHPDNGKDGFWAVIGTRCSGIVRATTAVEAREKSVDQGLVGDWEVCPTVMFLAPEVVEKRGVRI
jgi:hypothetical protein